VERNSVGRADDWSTYRIVPSRRDGVPAVEFEFNVTFRCELLEGHPAELARIADEFAAYLQRRDDQIGLIAARDWALLVDEVAVARAANAEPKNVIDVRRISRSAR
jgi:hypothetical protein